MHSISLPKVASRRSPRMPTPSGASALTCCTFPLCFLFPRLFCRCLFLSALLAKSLTKGSVSVLFKLLHDYSPDTLVCSAGVEACLLFCFCTSSRPASLPGAPRHCPAGRYSGDQALPPADNLSSMHGSQAPALLGDTGSASRQAWHARLRALITTSLDNSVSRPAARG